MCLAIAGCGSDDGGSANGGLDKNVPTAGERTEEDEPFIAIEDYALSYKQLDADKTCRLLTDAGQQRVIRNFGSTGTDCTKVLRREFSSVNTWREKRALYRGITKEQVTVQVEGRSGSGELSFLRDGKIETVPVKVHKVGDTWKVSDPGDETFIEP